MGSGKERSEAMSKSLFPELSVAPWTLAADEMPRRMTTVAAVVEIREQDGDSYLDWVRAFWNGLFWVADNYGTPNADIHAKVIAWQYLDLGKIKDIVKLKNK